MSRGLIAMPSNAGLMVLLAKKSSVVMRHLDKKQKGKFSACPKGGAIEQIRTFDTVEEAITYVGAGEIRGVGFSQEDSAKYGFGSTV